jgi:hypothetical protein
MKTTMMVVATAATLALTAVAAPQKAEAGGGRIAAGLIGGLAVGALIGSALAAPHYSYGPPAYGYYGGPVGYDPGCYLRRQQFWDGYMWRVRHVEVCG